MCFGEFLLIRTLCDAYHKEFESHQRSILDISGKTVKKETTEAERKTTLCDAYHKQFESH